MSRDALEGRVALVTGGAGGIGRGIARVFLKQGAAVVLGDIDREALKRAEEEFSGADGRVLSRELDVTNQDSIRSALYWAEERFGAVDILVNNAGVCLAHLFLEGSEQELKASVDVNLKGTLLVSQAFARRLIERKQAGNIVNIASNAAKRPYARYADYNATKAAVVALTHTLSQELAPYGINVNAVCPGAVDTQMLRNCMEEAVSRAEGAFSLEDCRRTWGPAQLGRLVRPEEVGEIVAFLASRAANIIRGQAISVDGGDTPY